eukprot:TRINITY_DN43691_c0_g1_i7.p1 TRINITY_DN43691_c0_g1~~TRINITY_DN43691_c0_g1_i7.p1  ORF type:complete len:247 (+),score=-14.66 TRINITY_DN43691_c0_g1_i7:198-938(+)
MSQTYLSIVNKSTVQYINSQRLIFYMFASDILPLSVSFSFKKQKLISLNIRVKQRVIQAQQVNLKQQDQVRQNIEFNSNRHNTYNQEETVSHSRLPNSLNMILEKQNYLKYTNQCIYQPKKRNSLTSRYDFALQLIIGKITLTACLNFVRLKLVLYILLIIGTGIVPYCSSCSWSSGSFITLAQNAPFTSVRFSGKQTIYHIGLNLKFKILSLLLLLLFDFIQRSFNAVKAIARCAISARGSGSSS